MKCTGNGHLRSWKSISIQKFRLRPLKDATKKTKNSKSCLKAVNYKRFLLKNWLNKKGPVVCHPEARGICAL